MIIGLTGRTATGKTTLASVFKDMGYEVFDADMIYAELFENFEPMRKKIFEEFKTLDRKEIFNLVRKDAEKLEKLNSITHGFVLDEMLEKVRESKKEKILLDVPIPVKRGFLDISDLVVCTTCSLTIQVERLVDRYGISKGEALERIGMQKSRGYYMELADYIVATDNTSREDLHVIAESIEGFIRGLGRTAKGRL